MTKNAPTTVAEAEQRLRDATAKFVAADGENSLAYQNYRTAAANLEEAQKQFDLLVIKVKSDAPKASYWPQEAARKKRERDPGDF